MKKRKIQSGKSVDEKLDHLTKTVDGLTKNVDGIIKSLAKMATKDELKNLETRLEAKMVTKDHFDRAVRMLVTKVEFDDFREYVHENMMTKTKFEERFDDFQDALLEMRDHSESRILFQGQHADLQDTVAKHGQRIAVLEKRVL